MWKNWQYNLIIHQLFSLFYLLILLFSAPRFVEIRSRLARERGRVATRLLIHRWFWFQLPSVCVCCYCCRPQKSRVVNWNTYFVLVLETKEKLDKFNRIITNWVIKQLGLHVYPCWKMNDNKMYFRVNKMKEEFDDAKDQTKVIEFNLELKLPPSPPPPPPPTDTPLTSR